MKFAIQLKAIPLFTISIFEMIVPFLRMFILTRLLTPYEFGFASALAATFATFQLITDIAISNFVFTSPRSVYAEAVAGAHALSLIRGFCVSCLILLCSKPVACTLATCNDWPSFAWLAPVTMIGSLEHLEIRVNASRDYKYWPPLCASIASHGAGLLAMLGATYKLESHYGYIAYVLVQIPVYVIMSHLLASHRYQVNYRTSFVRRSISFGLPLLVNGIGLAIMSQGDRWIVGSLLGLPLLGLYALITLAVFVPLSGINKIMSPVQFAGLHNAKGKTGEFDARLKLFSRAVPAIGAASAVCILAFLGKLLPAVFGRRYEISELTIFLLALIVYIRIIRTDPQNSLLFNAQDTRKLALAAQAPFLGLLATAGLIILHPTLESALIGGLIGEVAGLLVVGYVARGLLRPAMSDHVFSAIGMATIVIAAAAALWTGTALGLASRIVIAGGFLSIIFIYALIFLRNLYQQAYGASF